MKCSKCGNELKEDMEFCYKCGTKVEENTSSRNFTEDNTSNNKSGLGIGSTIWYIGTAILIVFLIFKWIGVPMEDWIGIGIFIFVVAVDSIVVVCISNNIENKFIKYIVLPPCMPIVVIFLLLGIGVDIDRERTEQANEFNRPYVEAKRQRMINDAYNRRFHK